MQSTENKHMCLVETTRQVTREIIADVLCWNKEDEKRIRNLREAQEVFSDKLAEEIDGGDLSVSSLEEVAQKRLREKLSRELAKIPGIVRRRERKERKKRAAKLMKAEESQEEIGGTGVLQKERRRKELRKEIRREEFQEEMRREGLMIMLE
ncbi:MAG: uncharacterized protein A8A55_2361 [Amphiamblys sp. WSBS2006]|nr:MAG: uncharacterized protein A8A55_2361 [Amphiamblys sp. WSBS2006]